MRIAEFLKVEAIVPVMTATTKGEVLSELADALAKANPQVSQARFLQVLDDREKLGSTGMEKGVAIPHGRMAELSTLMACLGVSRPGVDFDARDRLRSHFFFALVAPENSAGLHLKALSKLSRLFRSESLRDRLLQANSPADILAIVAEEDSKL